MFQNSEWLGRDGSDDGIVLLSVQYKNWGNITALDIIKSSSGSGVSGITMTKWSFVKSSEFEISSGFHRFTLGFDFETMNITVYMDGVYTCSHVDNSFSGSYAYLFECGYYAGKNLLPKGSGKLFMRECDGFIPTIETLYVNGDKGNDGNDGQSETKPLKTIGAAASKAMSGTTIYISDGVYRETFKCPSGDEKGRITFTGTGNKVYLSGSVLASTFQWTKGQNNIWSADVSSVMNEAPFCDLQGE